MPLSEAKLLGNRGLWRVGSRERMGGSGVGTVAANGSRIVGFVLILTIEIFLN